MPFTKVIHHSPLCQGNRCNIVYSVREDMEVAYIYTSVNVAMKTSQKSTHNKGQCASCSVIMSIFNLGGYPWCLQVS